MPTVGRNALAALERIVADERARRELLWLRAKEKEDGGTARDLERVDPDIVRRLREAGHDIAERSDELPKVRCERFARLFEECFERHARAG